MIKLLTLLCLLVEILCISSSQSRLFGQHSCYTEQKLNLGCFRSEGAFQAFPRPDSPSKIDVKFHIYSHANEFSQTISATSELIPGRTKLNLHHDGQVVFLVHGYHNSENNPMVRFLKQDFLELNPRNLTVVSVDWSGGATQSIFDKIYEKVSFGRRQRLQKREIVNYHPLPYGKSSSNTRVVGALIARLARFMKHGNPTRRARNIHCVGFSLGAQTCGFAGKRYLELSAGTEKLDRITGLDPAGPLFDGKDPAAHLWYTDADFVDVIHTNTFAFGFKEPVGHVDFYVGKAGNYGEWQPNCAGFKFGNFLRPARDFLRQESAVITAGGTNGEFGELSNILKIDSDEVPENQMNRAGDLELDFEIPISLSAMDLALFEKVLKNENFFHILTRSQKRNFMRKLQELDKVIEIERPENRGIVTSMMQNRVRRMLSQIRQRFAIACSHNRAWEYFGNSVRGVCRYRQPLSASGSDEVGVRGSTISMGYRAIDGFRPGRWERKVVNVDVSSIPPFCQLNEE